jgi:exosortase/archaeosortase family protein
MKPFLLKLAIFLLLGFAIRAVYHYSPEIHDSWARSGVIDLLYRMLMFPVSWLLSLSGIPHELSYSAPAGQYFIRLAETGNSLFLWIPCLGISLIYIYTALILSLPGTWKHKLLFSISGAIIIELLNISRLYVLAVLLSDYSARAATHSEITPWLIVSHETIFNYSIIALIFGFFVFATRGILKIKNKNAHV